MKDTQGEAVRVEGSKIPARSATCCEALLPRWRKASPLPARLQCCGKATIVGFSTTPPKQDSGTASVKGFEVAAKPGNVRQSIGLTGQFADVDAILAGRQT